MASICDFSLHWIYEITVDYELSICEGLHDYLSAYPLIIINIVIIMQLNEMKDMLLNLSCSDDLQRMLHPCPLPQRDRMSIRTETPYQ